MKTAEETGETVAQAVGRISQFAEEQLTWHTRRGSKLEREAARRFAGRVENLRREVLREMEAEAGRPQDPGHGHHRGGRRRAA